MYCRLIFYINVSANKIFLKTHTFKHTTLYNFTKSLLLFTNITSAVLTYVDATTHTYIYVYICMIYIYIYIYVYIYIYNIYIYIYIYIYMHIYIAFTISSECIKNAMYECICLRKPVIDGLFSSENCV